MKDDLFEYWLLKLKEANNKNLTRFIFQFNSVYYICDWKKNQWGEPEKIDII